MSRAVVAVPWWLLPFLFPVFVLDALLRLVFLPFKIVRWLFRG